MPTKFLVVETPQFQLGANAGANTERLDPSAFGTRWEQHVSAAKAGSSDLLFVLAPAETRMQPSFGQALNDSAPHSLAFFATTQDAIQFLPTLLTFDGAERAGGAKEFLAKGSTVFTETLFNAKSVGTKLDPCYGLARSCLSSSVAMGAWACLQSMAFLGIQSLPEAGEKGTGERVDVQIGADFKTLILSVRFDLIPEQVPFLQANPVLSVPRFTPAVFELRYLQEPRKVELTCLFYRGEGPSRTVEISSRQATAALESGADVKDYNFRPFATIAANGAPDAHPAGGGFKKKFSSQVVATSAPAASAPATVQAEAPAPYAAKLVVSGQARLAPEPKVLELESKVRELEVALQSRQEVLAKMEKENSDPTKKRDLLTNIKDSQSEGLKQNIKMLEDELAEAKSREKELMTMVDKAVQFKEDSAKKIKELEVKLKAASSGGGSKVQMLEKAIEEQKRQNKVLSSKVTELNDKLKAA